MLPRDELLESIDILVQNAKKETTQIYVGLVTAIADSGNKCTVKTNGKSYREIIYYGDVPTVNKQYRVFVPNGSMNQAFIITGGNSSISGDATDYNKLSNRPQINGVTLSGNKTSADLGIDSDKTFVFEQNTASSLWDIKHNLNKFPSVTIIDSAGSQLVGNIVYTDINNIIVTFSATVSGKAYLN